MDDTKQSTARETASRLALRRALLAWPESVQAARMLAALPRHLPKAAILGRGGALERAVGDVLFQCVKENDAKAIRAFLKIKGLPSGDLLRELLSATLYDNADLVLRAFLSAGVNPNSEIASGWLAYQAARHGATKCLQALFDAGGRLTIPSGSVLATTTPLEIAAHKGMLSTVHWLLDHGVVPDDGDLRKAAEGDCLPVVRLFIDRGIDPWNLSAGTRFHETLLHAAARGYGVDCLRFALQLGMPVDGKNKYGETALAIAVSGDRLSVARELLQAGAVPDPGTIQVHPKNPDRARRLVLAWPRLSAAERRRFPDPYGLAER